MRIAHRRRARRERHDPAEDGLPRHADCRTAQSAHLGIGWRLVVRSEGPVAGVAGRYVAEGVAHALALARAHAMNCNRFNFQAAALFADIASPSRGAGASRLGVPACRAGSPEFEPACLRSLISAPGFHALRKCVVRRFVKHEFFARLTIARSMERTCDVDEPLCGAENHA